MSKSLRNESKEYVENKYWEERLPNYGEETDLFKNNISQFTFNIEKK